MHFLLNIAMKNILENCAKVVDIAAPLNPNEGINNKFRNILRIAPKILFFKIRFTLSFKFSQVLLAQPNDTANAEGAKNKRV